MLARDLNGKISDKIYQIVTAAIVAHLNNASDKTLEEIGEDVLIRANKLELTTDGS